MGKLLSVTREDGYVWLACDVGSRRIYLHRQAKPGDCYRPGQRINPNR